MSNIKSYMALILILLLHLILSTSYASLIPLGEAPDEPAQLNYARFIAGKGRLPTTLEERQAADYRSNWPPLYHALIALPTGWVGQAPPTRLKAVGDTARRLIPTNGQTIAAFIHTADEAWPWRGLPLAWHLSRFVSVGLTALAVLVTYLIAWQLTRRRTIAALAAAIHAFIPQRLFIGSVVNDDNLLILLSSLVLLTLIGAAQNEESKRPFELLSLRRSFGLGLLLGLATVTKYNALPLWGVVAVWYGYHTLALIRRRSATPDRRSQTGSERPHPNPERESQTRVEPYHRRQALQRLILAGVLLLSGAALSGGWWFVFIWQHFNQIKQLGWLRGSLAALVASASDASLRNLTTGSAVTFPGPAAWLEWFTTLFQSFWGRFGGGGSIEFPLWVYWLLALFCLLALLSRALRPTHHAPRTTYHASLITLFLLTPLFFLPLPIARFILTGGNIVETAQGRHLFPALPAIALGLAWGLAQMPALLLSSFTSEETHPIRRHRQARDTPYAIRHTVYNPAPLLALILITLSLTALPLIRNSYPPPIPLRTTTAAAATAENIVKAKLTGSLTLIGYDLGPVEAGILPLTLVWQATATPPQDYLINLTLNNTAGQPLGGWLGHPLGGRYPTRAWDKGDVLRHTIPLPLLPNLPAAEAALSLRLLDAFGQPATEPLRLAELSLPSTAKPQQKKGGQNEFWSSTPFQLRADHLPVDSPFTYRSTLTFMLPNIATPPELVAPDGKTFSPTQFLTNQGHSLAHYIVAADWPSGNYHLQPFDYAQDSSPHLPISPSPISISNRPRQFEPPPVQHPLEANFGGLVTLLGYDLPQHRLEPGDSFPITLYWRAETVIGQNLVVFNHLLDSTLTQRGGRDRIPLNHYTSLLWVPGEIVIDTYQVPVDPLAPPGVYWLDVGLYPTERSDFSLPLYEGGQPIDRNSVPLGPLKVGGPPPDITLPEANPQYPVKATFGDQITLLGFDLLDADGNLILIEQETNGLQLPITNLHLYWQAETSPAADYTVFLHLLDDQNNLAAQFDGPPASGSYPTGLWDPGEIIVDQRTLNALPNGRYTLKIGLYRSDTGQRLPLVQTGGDTLNLIRFEVRQH